MLGVLALLCRDLGLWKPVLSYDNAPIHNVDPVCAFARTTSDGAGLVTPEREPLAGKMPDGNKVIEHCFPTVRSALFKSIVQQPANSVTARKAQQLLEQVIEVGTIAPASVAKDALTLPLTMKIIAHDKCQAFEHNGESYIGTGGDWPRKQHR